MKTIVVVGPTASGKTALSLDLARRYNGVIICADSRTIYKELDIGTAKPTADEQRAVQHYGIDFIYPNERYSAMQFKEYCSSAVQRITEAHKTPILVGGSGLYVDAYLYNYQPPEVDMAKAGYYENASITELHAIISERHLTMPHNNKNKLHLIHTILRDGKLPTKSVGAVEKGVIIGINPPRDILKQRITRRVQLMIADGVVQEAKAAFEKYGYDAPGLQGGIYKQLALYHKGLIDLETMTSRTITSDFQLAKRQMTWFKRNKTIRWFTDSRQARNWLDEYLQGTL